MGKTVYNNNQKVVCPFDEATGAQLREHLNIREDRLVTVTDGGVTQAVPDHAQIHLRDGMVISDAPNFEYGAVAPPIVRRLEAERQYLQAAYRQPVTFGRDSSLQRWWVQLQQFALPHGWNYQFTPILVTVGDEYPRVAPDGFFLSNNLSDSAGRTPAHYFESRSAHNRLTNQGWAWFCLHPRGWRASFDIFDGDSVVKYLTLIHLAMSQVVRPGFYE